MTISPPKVRYKRPDMRTFLGFLQSKGWSLVEQTKNYYALQAPVAKGQAQDFVFRLPANENSRSFDHLAFLAVETFADLYRLPLQSLFELLAKPPEDLRRERDIQSRQMKIKREILEHVA